MPLPVVTVYAVRAGLAFVVLTGEKTLAFLRVRW